MAIDKKNLDAKHQDFERYRDRTCDPQIKSLLLYQLS